ncbi:MAG: 50S ribosomal protein L23 [Nitrospirae bacterium]|nr:50S ribosomal protein L23 [Nitrospirota bacterium]
MNLYDVIKKPLITEKGTTLKEKENKVMFVVDIDANKMEIKKAVETAFKVKVENVATITLKGKKKRMGARLGQRSDWKKAIVTLRKGDTLEYLEGVK